MTDADRQRRLAGLFALVLGAVAIVGYAVLGASPASPGLPTLQLALAALLVVSGAALRQGRGPAWGVFVVGALTAWVAYDLVRALLT